MSSHNGSVENAKPARGSSEAAADATFRLLPYDVSFEFAPDCMLLTDRSGIVLNINHAAIRYFGIAKSTVLGKPMGLSLISGHRGAFYEHLTRMVASHDSCAIQVQVQVPRHQQSRDVLLMGAISDGGMIRWAIYDNTIWREAEFARIELMRRLVSVQEDERRRLARDLHDNAGQLLTALRLALSTAKDSMVSQPATQPLDLAQRMADELARVLHHIAHGLRSGLIEEAGLHAAIEQLVSEWEKFDSKLAVDLEIDAIAEWRLPREIESAIYSVIQEALTNVHRHAKAEWVRIAVARKTDHLQVAVEDNGFGFDPILAGHQSAFGRLGLAGMRERVWLVGGTLDVKTAPGRGTLVCASIPIPESL